MINFDIIKNPKLRLLVIPSESINSLPEVQAQTMIERIAKLPPEGEQAMIKALTDEQEQIAKMKQAKGITPEMERQQLEQKMQKMVAIKNDFERTVRIENEKADRKDSDRIADNLIKNI